VIMSTMAAFWSFHGHFTPRRHVPLSNVARFWAAAVTVWIVGFAVLYFAPALT
jgi:cytochrome c oxidase subunit I+III